MKTIEIDNDVYGAIERHAQGFNQTPNAVLRKVLGVGESLDSKVSSQNRTSSSLNQFLGCPEYVSATTADERYLKLISWLMQHHVELRSAIDGYRVRKRVLFAKEANKIQGSAKGVTCKRIPDLDFPFFAMLTLDNPSKRKILGRVLSLAGYPAVAMEGITRTLPNSGISRASRLNKTLEDYA